MSTQHLTEPIIGHRDVLSFAEGSINLRRDHAKKYRNQVNRLRERLETYIRENPDVGLVRMMLSGSLAKGTALKTINDIDVAVYVRAGDSPSDEAELLRWLAERLRSAYPQMSPDQISPGDHCVRISFKGTGLDIDVVPIHYEGDPDWRGYLFSRETGKRVLTSIPMHIKFIRKRKDAQSPQHFAQVVRLLKWWTRIRKREDDSLRFKSFMAELVCAHLADGGLELSHYPNALERVFGFIAQTGLRRRIAFEDYYRISDLPGQTGDAIEIFDPVNAQNNVGSGYSEHDRANLADSTEEAVDALAEARFATTKGRATDCWKRILGPSFEASS